MADREARVVSVLKGQEGLTAMTKSRESEIRDRLLPRFAISGIFYSLIMYETFVRLCFTRKQVQREGSRSRPCDEISGSCVVSSIEERIKRNTTNPVIRRAAVSHFLVEVAACISSFACRGLRVGYLQVIRTIHPSTRNAVVLSSFFFQTIPNRGRRKQTSQAQQQLNVSVVHAFCF